MGKFDDARNEKKERVERDFKVREKLSGFFFDLAKLVFAAMVLGGLTPILSGSEDTDMNLVISGIFATEVLFFIGYKILR